MIMHTPFPEIKKIAELYSAEEIDRKVKEAARQIADRHLPTLEQAIRDRKPFKLVFVAVLSGASRYRTALANEVGRILAEQGYYGYLEEDEISVSSYPEGETAKEIRFLLDTKRSIAGAPVILVEDIIDQGTTASWVMDMLQAKKPACLELYVLVDKTPRREKRVKPTHVGFCLEKDLYVLGYGLDVNGRFRDLPYIGYAVE